MVTCVPRVVNLLPARFPRLFPTGTVPFGPRLTSDREQERKPLCSPLPGPLGSCAPETAPWSRRTSLPPPEKPFLRNQAGMQVRGAQGLNRQPVHVVTVPVTRQKPLMLARRRPRGHTSPRRGPDGRCPTPQFQRGSTVCEGISGQHPEFRGKVKTGFYKLRS